jgi:hypothetical protein
MNNEKKEPSREELLAGLLEVQVALACYRDGLPYIHPEHGELRLEEVKYCIVDPLCGNDEEEVRAKAKVCPSCGSKNLKMCFEWRAWSLEKMDRSNRAILFEYQCDECSISFWL